MGVYKSHSDAMPNEEFGKRGADRRTPEERGQERQQRIMRLAGEINRLEDERQQLLDTSSSDRVNQDRRSIDDIDRELALKRAELTTLKDGSLGSPGR